MKRFFGWGGVILLLGLGIFFYFKLNKDMFLNPLSGKKSNERIKNDLVTFGFLPTWMVGKTRLYESEVSHLVFLGVESDEEGNLIWDVQSKKINGESFLATSAARPLPCRAARQASQSLDLSFVLRQ